MLNYVQTDDRIKAVFLCREIGCRLQIQFACGNMGIAFEQMIEIVQMQGINIGSDITQARQKLLCQVAHPCTRFQHLFAYPGTNGVCHPCIETMRFG